MKKFALFLGLILLFTGCQQGVQQNGNDSDQGQINLDQDNTNQIKTPFDEDTIDEAYERFNTQIPNLSQDEATQYFYDYEYYAIQKLYRCVETYVGDEDIQKALIKAIDKEGRFEVDLYQGKEKDSIESKIKCGYTFVSYGGIVYPMVNYDSFASIKDYVDDEAGSYIDLKVMDIDNYRRRGSEVEEALIMAENHLKNYPKGPTESRVQNLYKSYFLSVIPYDMRHLSGQPVSEESLLNCQSYIDGHTSAVSAQMMKDYMALLKEHDNTVSDEVLAYFDHMDDPLNELLEKQR